MQSAILRKDVCNRIAEDFLGGTHDATVDIGQQVFLMGREFNYTGEEII